MQEEMYYPEPRDMITKIVVGMVLLTLGTLVLLALISFVTEQSPLDNMEPEKIKEVVDQVMKGGEV